MPGPQTILLLTDSPRGATAQDLDLLYPGRLTVRDFTTEAHDVDALRAYDHVITLVHAGTNLPKLDYAAVEAYARGGGQVISGLFEYAQSRRLHFSKTHVADRIVPAMEIAVECDVTKGFAPGDTIPWHGTVSGAPEPQYANQMLQRQVMGVAESERMRILATSNVNGGAVLVEECVGDGRMLALDLLSPGRPFFNASGSANKYLFIGNAIGRSVHFGRHYPRKLSYDEFVAALHALAARHPQLRLSAEAPCSDGRQMWSIGLGDEGLPTLYFGAAIHGWE
ncbi:MAG: hypothetical protein HY332_21670 [Chloroflexi bacterium]|nr:hypothetical protein [Chloroflexota bacterium]